VYSAKAANSVVEHRIAANRRKSMTAANSRVLVTASNRRLSVTAANRQLVTAANCRLPQACGNQSPETRCRC